MLGEAGRSVKPATKPINPKKRKKPKINSAILLPVFCFFVGSYCLWQYSFTSPSSFMAMSGFAKLRRGLSRGIVLVIVACVAVIYIAATRAQQITQQPAQRPRRVGGSEQTTEAKKGSQGPEEVDEGDVIKT